MSFYLKICAVGAAFAVGLGGASSGMDTDALEQGKQDVVRSVTRRVEHTTPAAALLDAAARAATLTRIDASTSPDTARVTVRLSGEAICDVFPLEGGRKIVIDFFDTVNLAPGRIATPDDRRILLRVRTSLYAVEPQFVSRVVLDLATPCTVSAERSPNRADIMLSPTGKAFEAKQAIEETIRERIAEIERDAIFARVQQAMLEEQCLRRAPAIEHAIQRTRLRVLESALGQVALASGTTQDPDAARLDDLIAAHARAQDEFHKRGATLVAGIACRVTDHTHKLEALLASGADSHALAGRRLEKVCAAAQEAKREDIRTFKALYAEWQAQDQTLLTALDNFTPTPPLPEAPPETVHAIESSTTRAAACLVEHVAALRAHNGPIRPSENARAKRYANFLRNVGGPPPPRAQRIAQLTEDLEAVRAANLDFGRTRVLPLAALEEGSASSETDEAAEPAAEAETPAPEAAAPAPEAEAEEPAVETVEPVTDTVAILPPAEETPAEEPAPPALEILEAEEVPEELSHVVVSEEGMQIELETPPDFEGDPLDQLVTIDFRAMPLQQVVFLLGELAQLNVMGGDQLAGTVTANLRNVPLRYAIENALETQSLGIVEKKGVYHIVELAKAQAARRERRLITLVNAQADAVQEVLTNLQLPPAEVKFAAIAATNTVVIEASEDQIDELEDLVQGLDAEEQILPTETRVIKLKYSEPSQIQQMVQNLATKENNIGKVAADERSRQIIVTDYPVVLDEIQRLVELVDIPVKQVLIEAMIVDAVLSDASQTGVDWVLNALRRQNTRGELIGNLSELSFDAQMPVTQTILPGSTLRFGILSSEFDISGLIAAEVLASNADILANPTVVTTENSQARISISEEIPYQELSETEAGGRLTSTEFKEVGTVLEVTPRVTHDNHVIVDLLARQSIATEISVTGVPVEDKREAETNLLVYDGQSVFIGGLRKFQDRRSVRKVPIIGDIPVAGALFRNNLITQEITELLVFLTCHVIPEMPDLTPRQQAEFDQLGASPRVPETQQELLRMIAKPNEMRDPAWKFRREK